MNTLKRYLSISIMILTTIALTVFAVLPHHHHDGLVCMITEVCDSNGSHDDTNHHNCVSESDIILSSNKEEINGKSCVCQNCDHTHHFPILYLLAEFLLYEELSVPGADYGEFIVSYKSMNASQPHGLRAPPIFLL